MRKKVTTRNTLFSIMEVFILAFFAAALVLSSRLPGVQAGTIFAILTYVNDLIDGLDTVPTLVQQFSRLRDIARRMQLDVEADEPPMVEA
jgi:ABC-type multidrug transport system fused ATPase/permease subunit